MVKHKYIKLYNIQLHYKIKAETAQHNIINETNFNNIYNFTYKHLQSCKKI